MWAEIMLAVDPALSPDSPVSYLQLITSGGAIGTITLFGWLVTRGTFRHERELKAKDDELARERAERERERKENDAAVERLQKELNDTNRQLLTVLETGRRSQNLADRALNLAAGSQAPNVQTDKP